MAISSQGATFTFPGLTAHFTSISVEEPQAEIVDATAYSDPVGTKRMVATGDYTQPGRVRVDYIRLTGGGLPAVGSTGQLSLTHASVSVTKKAIVESLSTEVAVDQFVRGSIGFVIDSSP